MTKFVEFETDTDIDNLQNINPVCPYCGVEESDTELKKWGKSELHKLLHFASKKCNAKNLIDADELIKYLSESKKGFRDMDDYNRGYVGALNYSIDFIRSKLPKKEEELMSICTRCGEGKE